MKPLVQGKQVIAFDLGGVLAQVQAPQNALHEQAFFASHFEALTLGQLHEREYLQRVAGVLGVSIEQASFFFNELVRPAAFASRLLERLRAPFVIWSNINQTHYVHLAASVPAIDQNRHRHALSFELEVKKPDPRFFAKALLKLDPSEHVIFFDDCGENIAEARAQGICCEHVTNPLSLPQRLAELGLLDSQEFFQTKA
jgi:HAD superfamily hydrolase (TIGR01509 family)